MTPPTSTLDHGTSRVAVLVEELARRVTAPTLVRAGEPLAQRTTLRVGGPADIYVEPASEADLAGVVNFCGERNLPLLLLGRGSNLLVRDGGFRGVVVCLGRPCFGVIEVEGSALRCGAGARLKTVAHTAKSNGLSGFEFLEGIPGSVGGALRMNAGAMGSAMFEIVDSVRVMDAAGQVRELEPASLRVGYRCSEVLKTHIALGAVLRGRRDEREAIERRMNEYNRKRWASQPAAPSAGCIFKNPPGVPAGRLIDELGLKGTRVGGAVVSQEHGNFIVNDGTATARDILGLIELVQERVRVERGLELEPEVEVVGSEG